MLYNVDYEVAGICILLILYYFLCEHYTRQSETTNAFRKFILVMILSETLDVLTAYTISYCAIVPAWINMTLNTIYLAMSIVMQYYYVKYACSYVGKISQREGIASKMEILCRYLNGFYFLILILNAFTGLLFFFSDGQYTKGTLYYLEFIMPSFYLMYTIAVVLRNKDSFLPKQVASISLFVILSTLGTIMQVVWFPNVLLSFFTGTLGAFLCMLALETPDYQKLMKTLDEFSEAKTQLEAADKAKTEFLTSMSHEIRTPINAVLGYNELILQKSSDSEIVNNSLNALSAGRALLSMVNDILDYTDIDDGKLKIANDEYPVSDLFADMIIYLEYNAKRKGLVHQVDIDENIPKMLVGDPVRIGQIVNNLVSNAVKYTKEGEVSLDIWWEENSREYGYLCVQVTDSGVGMSQEDVKNISECFVRLEDTNHRNIQGLGLGMSIVTRLLKLMDGQLKIESQENVGSSFLIKIGQSVRDMTPVGHVDESLESIGIYQVKVYAPDAKILFVDDNKMNLDLLTGLIKDTGADTVTAISGMEALEILKKEEFDLIFMDIMMPEMDGVETFREINRLKLCPEAPIIALTANAVAGAKEMYLKEGFDSFMPKPVTQKQMYKALWDFLPFDKVREERVEPPKTTISHGNALAEKFPFLDTKVGLEYCADSEEFYIEMLGSYLDSSRLKELDALMKEGNWSDYQVSIHALKSTSMSIGAVKLSNEAKALEYAVRDKDIQYVYENHSRVMKDYIEILSAISLTLNQIHA